MGDGEKIFSNIAKNILNLIFEQEDLQPESSVHSAPLHISGHEEIDAVLENHGVLLVHYLS
jgi:hypothetical protein